MIGFYYVIIKGYEEIYLSLPEKFQNWAFMLMYFVFHTLNVLRMLFLCREELFDDPTG